MLPLLLRLRSMYWHHLAKYPIVTHDPNILKAIIGELIYIGNKKRVSSRREKHKILLQTVHTVPGCVKFHAHAPMATERAHHKSFLQNFVT